MKKFFSFNKNHVYIFITVLCLVFIGACYFFIYVPHNEKMIQEQRFRTLQGVVNNIHSKIDNSAALLNNLLANYQSVRNDTINRNALYKYIDNQPKSNFILGKPTDTDKKTYRDSSFNSYIIKVNNASQVITLTLRKKYYPDSLTDSTAAEISMRFSFTQFIKNLLPVDVFDEYIIFSKGAAVYESFPSGISHANSDSLQNIKNGIGGASVRKLTVSGKDYKIFLQPVSFDNSNEWVISGLLLSNRYQQERMRLPAQIIMLLVTLVLAMIVSFPWIKLYQMGSKDRLTIMDGIGSIIVSMLLMSLLFFSFFKYNRPLRPDDTADSKSVLAKAIAHTFNQEIDTAYRLVRAFDSIKAGKQLTEDIRDLDNSNIAYGNSNQSLRKNNDTIISTLNKLAKNANINQVFWLDSNGKEVINWITEDENAPHGNFALRDYFTRILDNKTYFLYNDAAKKFYLDQIVSWTSGTFTSVISIPSLPSADSSKIAAMSFTIKSLKNITLPTGYLFAITSSDGKVLYHSQPSRNLNENLLSEFSESDKLASCLQGHTEGTFVTNYFSRNYNVKVAPLQGFPYHIVVLADTAYKETRDIEVYTITFCMLFLFFGFLVAQLSIMFLASSRRSFFKKQLFDTSWIGPKASCIKEYTLASGANICLIILMIIFLFIDTSFLQYLFILIFSVTFIGIFLNILFARRYLRQRKRNNYRYKMLAIRWLVILLLLTDALALILLEWNHFFVLLIYELLAFYTGIALLFAERRLAAVQNNLVNKLRSKWIYTQSFSLMVLTRLIITSGLPVAFFYITAYNYEQDVSIRYKELVYGDRLVNQYTDLRQRLADMSKSHFDTSGIFYDGAWIKENPSITNAPVEYKPEQVSTEVETSLQLLNFLRFPFTKEAVGSNRINYTLSADNTISFSPMNIGVQRNSGIKMSKLLNSSGTYLMLQSDGLSYHIHAGTNIYMVLKGVLFWLLLLAALTGFYFIIYNILKKLFALNIPDLKIWKNLDEKIITDTALNRLLFVIGLPGAGKLNYILKKIEAGQIVYSSNEKFIYNPDTPDDNNVFVADLINIPDSKEGIEKDTTWLAYKLKIFAEKNRLIIVNHFEYNIQDDNTNRAKLNLLENMMLDNKCKIIILSTIHPVAFLDSVNDYVFKAKEPDNAMPGHDLERWHVLLGHYRIAIVPLPAMEILSDNNSWKQLICRETQYTHFLHAMQKCTLDIARGLPAEEVSSKTDELAFKLQVTAHYFYMYIWQSLTKEEKFLLYDLAEDNLVNSYDDYNLSLLIGKGVIIHVDGTLVLFNKGFRNFILTAIGNIEAMKIKDEIKDNGNWSKLRTPLVLVILAILAFLLISQQEAYTKLLTYAAALSAGVPAILRIFSVFDKNTQKTG